MYVYGLYQTKANEEKGLDMITDKYKDCPAELIPGPDFIRHTGVSIGYITMCYVEIGSLCFDYFAEIGVELWFEKGRKMGYYHIIRRKTLSTIIV